MWDPAFLITFAPVLLFSLTFHEFAHAWSAYRLGDPTAAAMGRLTMNPLRHLDVLGTLMLVISDFRFGWAKPVPVNVYNFRDPKFGMFVTAAAGPASNILLALCCGILLRLLGGSFAGDQSFAGTFVLILFRGMVMNLSLAFFNLIPIPPLDGSRILMGLGPESWEEPLMRFQQIGPMFLIGLIAIGFIAHVSPIWLLIGPFVKLFAWLFAGISLGF
jgi:Zn-dependent protease